MNWPHLHVIIVHFPILGIPVGFLLAVIGLWRRNRGLETAGLAMIVVASLVGLVAFASGQRAEEQLKAEFGLEETWVEPHEEAAEVARIALLVLAAAALGTLLVKRDSPTLPWLIGATALFALLSAVLVARSALLGGKIRHPELRTTLTEPYRGAPID